MRRFAEDILATVAEDKRPDQGIVRISVGDLRRLNLSVVSKPDARVLGHVVIPQVNSEDYAEAKGNYTSILLDLATLASQVENIVRWPPSLG